MTRRYNRGFSLIEVLVAFSIAAVSLGILFQIYAKGSTSAVVGGEYAQAIAIAESKLAEIGLSESLDAGDRNGSEINKFNWQISIQDYEEEQPTDFVSRLSLKQVNVTVSWHSRGKQRSITLNTIKPQVES